MMTRIGYSTAGFQDRDVDAALDAIAEAPFSQAEILGQAPHVDLPPTGRDLLAFRRRLVARGLYGGTVHAPMGRMVLGAPDEEWRLEAVGVLATYIRFAAGIAASGVVIHPVPNPKFVERGGSVESVRRIGEAVSRSLDDLVPVAEEAGTRILLENLPYHCEFPFLTMRELRPLVDGYPAEAVGLVADTGHAWTSGEDPCDEIRAAGPRLWGTHLQDVDYDNPTDNHWAPTEGGLDWEAIRSALREVKYEGAWTFEAERGRHDETAEQLARMCRNVAEAWGLRPAAHASRPQHQPGAAPATDRRGSLAWSARNPRPGHRSRQD